MYYSEYVSHMLKTYFCADGNLSPADKENCAAVSDVYQRLGPYEKNTISNVFSKRGMLLRQAVYEAALERGVEETEIWRVIKSVSKKIALRRGLM